MKIFIGCSSSNDIDKKYLEENKKLLDIILKDNDLVFGSCNNGIMGLAYSIAIKNEKEIIESIACIIKSKYEEKKHINIKFLLSYEKVLCKFSKNRKRLPHFAAAGVFSPFPTGGR